MVANPSSSRSLVMLLHQYHRVRVNATSSQLQGLHDIVPTTRIYYCGSATPGLRFISSGAFRIPIKKDQGKNEVCNTPPVDAAASSKPNLFARAKWLLGSILSIFLPFWKKNWDSFRRIEGTVPKWTILLVGWIIQNSESKMSTFQSVQRFVYSGEVEKVAEEVEEAAEVVALVASKTENAMAGVAVKLPENSLLKEAAVEIENASAVVAKDAQLTSNFIHKVEDMEQDLKDLEKMVEPFIEKMEKAQMRQKVIL